MPEVRVGQIWQDNDKRSGFRQLKVMSIEPAKFRRRAKTGWIVAEGSVARCSVRTSVDGMFGTRLVSVRSDRFKPNSTGYRLVAESEAQLEQQQ